MRAHTGTHTHISLHRREREEGAGWVQSSVPAATPSSCLCYGCAAFHQLPPNDNRAAFFFFSRNEQSGRQPLLTDLQDTTKAVSAAEPRTDPQDEFGGFVYKVSE